jgi:ribonuclease HI
MLYALDIWAAPTRNDHPGPRTTGTSKVTKQITTIQRAGALAITGGLRTSPTDALNACAHLLPAPLLINKICYRALTRLSTLPEDHPLHKVVRSKLTHRTRRHRGPLQNLTQLANFNIKNVEKIPTTARDPSKTGRLPFKISVAADKESSIKEMENASEEIQVFTDGSAQEGRVGAAAILTRKNRPDRILHFHLGPETEHTVHEAELVGILLGAHLISTERKGSTTCAIGVDNQAAISAFDSDLRKPGHHLAREIMRITNRTRKKRRKGKYTLTIRWTAGHVGIEGNEKADAEAKKAAEGLSSDTKTIPPYLRKPLLINPAAIRKAHNDKMKSEWKTDWRQTERGQKVLKIDKTTPSKNFLKTISNAKLSREAASKLSQLRLTHIPLNSYLYRFKRTDSARCPACGADKEDIDHFLLRCPKYAHERWALAKHTNKKRKTLSLKTLLGDPDMANPLANYIDATQRFKQEGKYTINQNGNATRE